MSVESNLISQSQITPRHCVVSVIENFQNNLKNFIERLKYSKSSYAGSKSLGMNRTHIIF